MKRTAVFSLFPFYIFNEEQFKFFNFLKLQKKKKAQIETSLCSAVTARRNGGRKSRPVRREDGGYAEGEKEEGGGEKKVVIEKEMEVKEKAKEVTVVPFSRLSELGSKNWKQWRSLISHHLHRVYSAV